MRILCVGIMVMDILAAPVTADGLHRDATQLSMLKTASGGDAMNVAMELVALGADVELIGSIGNDAFGLSLLESAKTAGVQVERITSGNDWATACSLVLIDDKAERHFFSYGDSFRHLTEVDVPDAAIAACDHVHIGSAMVLDSLDGEGLCKLFKRAKEMGKSTSMDVTCLPGTDQFWRIRDALYYTDYFMPSIYEVEQMCGSADIEEIKEFFKPYGLKVLVIKMGEKGCFATDFNRDYYDSAIVPPDRVVDTTGAGDSFVTGFIYGVSAKMPIKDAIRFASEMSAACVQSYGATEGVMNGAERLKKIAAEILKG